MLVTDIIAAKRDGRELSDDMIRYFIRGYVDGSIPDYQAGALLMAIYLNGMGDRELATWTGEMTNSGELMQWGHLPGVKLDKHSTGGVGDKTSLIICPLVAELGAYVPMMAGRGLEHTGGTLDKLEAIAGFETRLSTGAFDRVLRDVRGAIVGQTAEVAPADRKLYSLRDATATVACFPLIASSIMSKKLAEGMDALVLDVKVGSGAFMKNVDDARYLAKLMIGIGERAGRQIRALLTNMNTPLGREIGNANEVRECIDVMRGGGPADLRELTVELSAEMLVMGDFESSIEEARRSCAAALDDGRCLERFTRIVAAQGGDVAMIERPELLPQAPAHQDLTAPQSGTISELECLSIGRASVLIGGGRRTKEESIDHRVGITLHAQVGDPLDAGQPWCTLHYADEDRRDQAAAELAGALRFGEAPTTPLIIERVYES